MMHHPICGFEHLHRHSDFSLLDGFAMVSEYAERMKEINQKYLCITDHGVMGAVPQQVHESEKHNLFPLFGCELYINHMQPEVNSRADSAEYRKSLGDGSTEDRTPLDGGKKPSLMQKKFDKSSHLLAVAYNNVGYSNLVRLTSWAWIHGYYRRPRINHEVLQKYKEGIIFTTGCGNSEIANAFMGGKDEEGKPIFDEDAGLQMLEKYIQMIGPKHLKLEVMMLDWPMQKFYNQFLIKAHDKYRLDLMLSQDCHYCKKEHSHNQQLMLMQQNKRTLGEIQAMIDAGDADDIFELQDTNLWLKSEDELNFKWESDYKDIIPYELYKISKENTVKICEYAKGVEIDREIKLPKMPDADEALMEDIKRGFLARHCPKTPEYAKRIKEEYELICEKGFSSYFLIQKMMTDEAREKGPQILGFGDGSEAVGPGRGSVCGSLVAYCLRLHDVEPIIHDLRFSRFLSPARGGLQMRLRHTLEPIPHEVVQM